MVELYRSFYCLRKVLGSSLPLELLKFRPDFLRDFAGRGNTAEDAWKPESFEPSVQLLIEILVLRHLRVYYLVQNGLKFLLHLTDSGWDEVS